MDFLNLCQRRQSCRDFADRPVEHEKLERCLQAARLTPSACNSQPWSFVVVESPELAAQVARCTMQMGVNEYLGGAKAFIVVLEEHAVLMPGLRRILDSQYFAKHDLGAVATTICLAAEAEGLGTCIAGLFDREKLGQLLNLPPEQRFSVVIAVGYPASDKVRPKQRKSFEEIVRFV